MTTSLEMVFASQAVMLCVFVLLSVLSPQLFPSLVLLQKEKTEVTGQ